MTDARQHLVDLEDYFRRIGFTGEPRADQATLYTLHALHVDAIPFEALDVLMDRGISLSPPAIEEKLVHRRRGGYCLEQNLLLMNVLRQLGFEVEGLSARVRWMLSDDAPSTPRTHVALKVRLGERQWLADVGFGGSSLPRPLDLASDEAQSTCHESYRLQAIPGGWRIALSRQGRWLPLYDICDDPQSRADYEMMNWYTSRHLDSHFRRDLRVARTTPQRRYTLNNRRFTVSSGDQVLEQRDLDAVQLASTLADTFGLAVEHDLLPVLESIAKRTQ
ncbi:arylamine N-acetyltransferase family protein [Mangrovimicrobium sediminis]|uniref:arylamine N-acetyltransferase family protein n=1 Tax=Mangrovimicrobium sediminis TaxID=2562682 RepID=UPI0014367E89|nr:arylamine N-acetyltransferase [Haliea sp. SAOS-164]